MSGFRGASSGNPFPGQINLGASRGSSIQGATTREAAAGRGCSPEPKTSSDSTESASGSGGVLIGSAGRRRRGLCGNTTAAPGGRNSGTAKQRASTGAGKPSPPGSGRLELPAPRARLKMTGRRPRVRKEQSELGGECSEHLLLYRPAGATAREVTPLLGGGGRLLPQNSADPGGSGDRALLTRRETFPLVLCSKLECSIYIYWQTGR